MSTHDESEKTDNTPQQQPPGVPTVRKKSSPKKALAAIVLLLGMTSFGVGAYQLTQRHTATTGKPTLPNPAVTIAETITKPEEKKPTQEQASSYKVPNDQPRSITIKSVNIYGLVQRVGLTKENAVGTPSNVNFAGWYANAALPGAKDLSIIDGHYSGLYNGGVFKNLGTVKVNDVVEVEFGDKSIKKFSVVEVKKLPEPESAAYLFKKQDGIESQLNLITCGGKYNKAKQTFDDRTVVVTKLIAS